MTPQGSRTQDGGRRKPAVILGVLVVAGAALLVYALTGQVGAPPEPALRSAVTVSDGGGATDDASVAPQPAPAPDIAEDAPSPQPPPDPAAPPAASLEHSVPTALSIPSIGVEEQVFPIGLGAHGELLAPAGDRANLPAWFDGSPTPGETGPAVIEGHVTWRGAPSVFFELGALAPGDRIDVARQDGSTATFEVYDSARYPKDEFPTVAVYGRTDGPELRLITCGGDLDADGHHLDNTVVFARLVGS